MFLQNCQYLRFDMGLVSFQKKSSTNCSFLNFNHYGENRKESCEESSEKIST
jgi:hypothetical protein